jgi:hypothetical protein
MSAVLTVDEYAAIARPRPEQVLPLREQPALLAAVLAAVTAQPFSAAGIPSAPFWIAAVMDGADKGAATMAGMTTESTVCCKVISGKDICFKCLTCAADPTCVMCAECFRRSPCVDHDYRMVKSGGGMCDCGDPTAWKEDGFCAAHRGVSDGILDEVLAPGTRAWLTAALTAALEFIVRAVACALADAPRQQMLMSVLATVVRRLTAFASHGDCARRLMSTVIASAFDFPLVTLPAAKADDAADAADDDEGGAKKKKKKAAKQPPVAPKASGEAKGGQHHDPAAGAPAPASDDRGPPSFLHHLMHAELSDGAKAAREASEAWRGVWKAVTQLIEALNADMVFRDGYMKAFCVTACSRAGAVQEEGEGRGLAQFSVQTLTVKPVVEASLATLGAAHVSASLLSSLLGASLLAIARLGNRRQGPGYDLNVFETFTTKLLYHHMAVHNLRYVMYASRRTIGLLVVARPLFRAWLAPFASMQASFYVRRDEAGENLLLDCWDYEYSHTTGMWLVHDAIVGAVAAVAGGESPADALALPEALVEHALEPRLSVPAEGVEANTEPAHWAAFAAAVAAAGCDKPSSLLVAIGDEPTDRVVNFVGPLLADCGEQLAQLAAWHLAAAVAFAAAAGRQERTTYVGVHVKGAASGAAPLRVPLRPYDLITGKHDVTFCLPLLRVTSLVIKAACDGHRGAPDASLLPRLLSISLRANVADAASAARLVPYLVDAVAMPAVLLAQALDQLWRRDFMNYSSHLNIYNSWNVGHARELDHFMLQALAAAFGAAFVTTQLLHRFSYVAQRDRHSAGDAPPGYAHYLRAVLTLACDTTKTNKEPADEPRDRILRVLAASGKCQRSTITKSVFSFELDDDKKQQQRDVMVDKVLADVAIVERQRTGNAYRLNAEWWAKVNPYCAEWTSSHVSRAQTQYSEARTALGVKATAAGGYPLAFVPTDHNAVFSDVLPTALAAVGPVSVAVFVLVCRNRAEQPVGGATAQPGPAARRQQWWDVSSEAVTHAVDLLWLAVEGVKRVPGCYNARTRRVNWRAYEAHHKATVARHKWALADADTTADLFPIDLTQAGGLLHQALLLPFGRVNLKTTGRGEHALDGETCGLSELTELAAGDVAVTLEDVAPTTVDKLRSVVHDVETALAEDAADGDGGGEGEGEVGSSQQASATDAAAAKKAKLLKRQQQLMKQLKAKQSGSANALLGDGGGDGADDDAAAPIAGGAQPSLHECVGGFLADLTCAICREGASARAPLFLMYQRASSGVLARFDATAGHAAPAAVDDVTGHLNFCGHAAHLACFYKRCDHLQRSRRVLSQLGQDPLMGLHPRQFKGMQYVQDGEVLCPLCSNIVSALSIAPAFRATPAGQAAPFHGVSRWAKSFDQQSREVAERFGTFCVQSSVGLPISDGGALTDLDVVEVKGVMSDEARPVWRAALVLAQNVCLTVLAAHGGRALTFRQFVALSSAWTTLTALLSTAADPLDAVDRCARQVAHRTSADAEGSLAAGVTALTTDVLDSLRDWAADDSAQTDAALAHLLQCHVTAAAGDLAAAADGRRQQRSVAIRSRCLLRCLVSGALLPQQQAAFDAVAALASAAAPTLEQFADAIRFDDLSPAAASDELDAATVLKALEAFQFQPSAPPASDRVPAVAAPGAPSKAEVDKLRRAASDRFVAARAAPNVKLMEKYNQFFIQERGASERAASASAPRPDDDAVDEDGERVEAAADAKMRLVHCHVCGKRPQKPVMCLECGDLFCHAGDPPELIAHARACGRGTSAFLIMKHTTLLVVQAVNGRACSVPSVYVDRFGECDVGMRRGLPLQLDPERLKEFLQMWATCGWDHHSTVLQSQTWRTDAADL